MSTPKNSFVLYNDYIDTTDELSDEEAGKLFKMILAKVNGREFECESKLLRLVFKPIEKSLQRDLKKYENKLQERSNSGVIGNLKRWHPDLYEDYQKGKIDLEEAQVIAKSRKASLSDKSIAKVADSDSDSDSDSVTGNENENGSDGEGENKELHVNEAANVFWKNKDVLKEFGKAYKLSGPEPLKVLLEEFISHCKRNGKEKKTQKDFQMHFDNWLRKKKEVKVNSSEVDQFYKRVPKEDPAKLERF